MGAEETTVKVRTYLDSAPPSLTNNRKANMREVIVYNVASTTSFPTPAEQYRGYLLGFAVSTEVNDGIPETDTLAMIEREDGRVSMVLPNRIQFVEPYRAQLAATPAGIARACGMENEVEEAQESLPLRATLGGAE